MKTRMNPKQPSVIPTLCRQHIYIFVLLKFRNSNEKTELSFTGLFFTLERSEYDLFA